MEAGSDMCGVSGGDVGERLVWWAHAWGIIVVVDLRAGQISS